MDLKTHSYQCTVRWTMPGLTEPFLNIVGCCNFTEAKVGEVCTGQGLQTCKLAKLQQHFQKKKKKKKQQQKKMLQLAPENIKNCPSGVFFIPFSCSAGQFLVKSLQSLTAHA